MAYHLVKGTPEALIAEQLGVHRGTIARDIAYIRNSAKSWLDDLARDGFIHEYRMALEMIRDHRLEMQQLLPEASVRQKVQILRALDENVKLYLELLGETPAVHAFKRAVRKLDEHRRQPDVSPA